MAFNCPHCSEAIDSVIPKDRFDQVNQRYKDALADAEAKGSEVEKLTKRAAMADKLNEQIDQIRGELETTKAQTGRTLAMADAGVTSAEDREFVLWQYEKHGEGADFGEWLQGKQAEPTGYFQTIWSQEGAPAADPQPPAADPQPPRTPAPRLNGGVKPTPPTNGTPTAEQLNSMTRAELEAYNREHFGSGFSVPLMNRGG